MSFTGSLRALIIRSGEHHVAVCEVAASVCEVMALHVDPEG